MYSSYGKNPCLPNETMKLATHPHEVPPVGAMANKPDWNVAGDNCGPAMWMPAKSNHMYPTEVGSYTPPFGPQYHWNTRLWYGATGAFSQGQSGPTPKA